MLAKFLLAKIISNYFSKLILRTSYLGLIPEILWFGEIVISVSPPSVIPSPISILYVRSPVPTLGPTLGGMMSDEVALTDRAYWH